MATVITIAAAVGIAWWIGFAAGRRTARGEYIAALEVAQVINQHNLHEVERMEKHIRVLIADIEMRKESIWPHVL